MYSLLPFLKRGARGRAGRAGPWPGRTSRPVVGQDKPARSRAGQAALLPAARAGGCTPGKPPSCVPQGRGGTPGKPLSCLRQERKFRSCGWAGTRQYAWKTHIVRAPGGGEELSVLGTRCGGGLPRSPRRGLRLLPSPLRGLCPLDPRRGGSIPPTPLLRAGCVTARDNSRFGAAAKRRACAVGHLACAPDGGEELPILETRCGGGLPRSPREGAAPPSIPSKGALPPGPPNGGRCPPYPPLKDRDSAKSKGQNKATTRAEKSSIPTKVRRPKAACATQSSLPSFLSRKRGGEECYRGRAIRRNPPRAQLDKLATTAYPTARRLPRSFSSRANTAISTSSTAISKGV